MQPRLILASASPQRRSLLAGAGINFVVHTSNVDESACTEVEPRKRAQVLARVKAQSVAAVHPDAFVLGADTLVVSSAGELLEKPIDAADARRMLQLHSGQTSTVHSAVCLCTPDGKQEECLQSSTVQFAELTPVQIDWWIQTGEWQDRSGAFQIDGKGQMLIAHMEGDWTGVVGLPMFHVGTMLHKYGLANYTVGNR